LITIFSLLDYGYKNIPVLMVCFGFFTVFFRGFRYWILQTEPTAEGKCMLKKIMRYEYTTKGRVDETG